MKRFILLLAIAFLFAPARPIPARNARADSLRYAVAADSNVWFYASESESDKLFLVPETYYVRVLSEGEVYTAVEYLVNEPPYKKLMGYCRTAALTFVDFIPARPFLKRQITVSYTIPDNGGLDGQFSSIERTFVYYGMRYQSGQLYFYVLADGKFGYIPAEEPLEYERNDDWLSQPAPPVSGEEDPPAASEGPSAWQIALICGILIAAAGLAVLVLRGRKTPPGDDP